MFLAMKYGESTANVADAYVPSGFPFGHLLSAVSSHSMIVLSAPAPFRVM